MSATKAQYRLVDNNSQQYLIYKNYTYLAFKYANVTHGVEYLSADRQRTIITKDQESWKFNI